MAVQPLNCFLQNLLIMAMLDIFRNIIIQLRIVLSSKTFIKLHLHNLNYRLNIFTADFELKVKFKTRSIIDMS